MTPLVFVMQPVLGAPVVDFIGIANHFIFSALKRIMERGRGVIHWE
jgi:hypothetical protein